MFKTDFDGMEIHSVLLDGTESGLNVTKAGGNDSGALAISGQ